MRFLQRDTAQPAGHDYVDCDGTSPEYCLDALAAGTAQLHELCRPCLALVMPHLDVAAGRDLPWAPEFWERAGLTPPQLLEAITTAGVSDEA